MRRRAKVWIGSVYFKSSGAVPNQTEVTDYFVFSNVFENKCSASRKAIRQTMIRP